MSKHDMSKTKTYKSWAQMKYRCGRLKHYENINYCDEWKLFENFLKDMGERPIDCTIDRIDNLKGYSKDNCRWATKIQQQNNRTNNLKMSYNDKKLTLSEWSRELGIKRSTLAQRYYVYHWNIEKTLMYKRGEAIGGA